MNFQSILGGVAWLAEDLVVAVLLRRMWPPPEPLEDSTRPSFEMAYLYLMLGVLYIVFLGMEVAVMAC